MSLLWHAVTLSLVVGALICVIVLIRHIYWWVRLEVVGRSVIDDDDGCVELLLSDGSRWRSKHGVLWHSFPHGDRAFLELETWLAHENDRLGLIDKWSGGSAR